VLELHFWLSYYGSWLLAFVHPVDAVLIGTLYGSLDWKICASVHGNPSYYTATMTSAPGSHDPEPCPKTLNTSRHCPTRVVGPWKHSWILTSSFLDRGKADTALCERRHSWWFPLMRQLPTITAISGNVVATRIRSTETMIVAHTNPAAPKIGMPHR
jgi:hypothetical protein